MNGEKEGGDGCIWGGGLPLSGEKRNSLLFPNFSSRVDGDPMGRLGGSDFGFDS